MNTHDKRYKRIFNNPNWTWEKKLEKAEEYALKQIKDKVELSYFIMFTKRTCILNFNLN